MTTNKEIERRPHLTTDDGRKLVPCNNEHRIQGQSYVWVCNRVAGHVGDHQRIDPRSFEVRQSWFGGL